MRRTLGGGAHELLFVTVGRHRVGWLQRGDGPPLVLLHGLGGSWRWWMRNIEPLAQHFTVYALDLGRRTAWWHGRDRVRPTDGSAVLAGWMAAVGLSRAAVVGHSLGATMALRLAADHPERVSRLVLVNAASLLGGTPIWRLLHRGLGPPAERSVEFPLTVVTDALRTNPIVVWQTAQDIVRDDPTAVFDHVACPVLVVWGARDSVVPVAHADELRRRLPHSRVAIQPSSAHNPMFYHADWFNRQVCDFLSEGETGAVAAG